MANQGWTPEARNRGGGGFDIVEVLERTVDPGDPGAADHVKSGQGAGVSRWTSIGPSPALASATIRSRLTPWRGSANTSACTQDCRRASNRAIAGRSGAGAA